MEKKQIKIKTQKLLSSNWLIALIRLLIGGVFIFSGFVKAIDPWGSYYKFLEYVNQFGLAQLEPFLMFFGVTIAIFEFMFGIFILTGCYRKMAPWILSITMCLFTPLTFYLWVTDNIKDCGCFGDAIQISNGASFLKNLFLLIGLIYLIKYNKKFHNYYGRAVQWIVVVLSFSFPAMVAFAGYFYQPLIDFRPYKVGTSILGDTTNTSNIEDNFTFIYEKNGAKKDFSIDSLPDESWNFVERVQKGDISSKLSIHGISIIQDGEDIADKLVPKDGEVIFLLFPDLNDVDISFTYMINEMYEAAKVRGINMIGLTSASEDEIKNWNDLSMASYKLYTIDDSELKQLARGNPSIVFIKDGKIRWKRTLQSISKDMVVIDDSDLSASTYAVDNGRVLYYLVFGYIGSMIILFFINRTHKVFKIKRYFRNKNQNNKLPLQN